MRLAFQRTIGLWLISSTGFLVGFQPNGDDFIRQLLARFRAYNEQRPTEKVYLYADRQAYLTGETIWLKKPPPVC